MTRYVLCADAALWLAQEERHVADHHELFAPTLLRSQVLSLLHGAVQRGELTKEEADRRLGHVRGIRMRLLGDRVLQDVAWKIADELGWPDTYDAEYVALTRLQADAMVTLDPDLARTVAHLVTVAAITALT